MKAAIMYGANDIRVEEIDKPACPEGGFILKVLAIGLCGSDIRNLTTDSRKGAYPHIYGHEIVGVIDEVSPTTTEYKLGQRIYIYPADHCMKCEECRSGHSENCENLGDYTSRQGGFADYVPVTKEQVDRDSIFVVPDGVGLERASLGEPLSSVYACQDNVDIGFGDTVVIIGAGPIGCFHAKLAKLRGAKTVIMIEINDKRLEMTKQFGVDYTINSTKVDQIAEVMKITNGKGADKVISANPSTAAQAQSIFMARKGGIIVFFGGVAKGAMTELDTNYIHYNNLWIYGHFGANSMQVQKAFELAISDEFEADKFITHTLPLSEINKGIQLTKTGEAIKVVLLPNEE
ncbi:MAG: alcohol dehydrogenase catalytic domain-containing protein [Anaerostipes sp.]|nr:alcohol dehydrogenase catalytic domain-containing protein [Anaerostipes sp.]MDD3745778.1 alcohol dehydrogenase catalytic domain-containing protein [Anaerostipes sp.]